MIDTCLSLYCFRMADNMSIVNNVRSVSNQVLPFSNTVSLTSTYSLNQGHIRVFFKGGGGVPGGNLVGLGIPAAFTTGSPISLEILQETTTNAHSLIYCVFVCFIFYRSYPL